MKRFLDYCLRGSGQVMFQNHPICGLLFLVGILAGASLPVALGALLGVAVSTGTALLLRVEREGVEAGLYGYNGLLVGAALPTFLADHPLLWAAVAYGAAVSSVVFMAVANVARTWGTSALTFPFVLVAWTLVLGAQTLSGLPADAASPVPSWPLPPWVEGTLNGVAQVFLVQSPVTGLLFLLGLAVSSAAAATCAVLGSLLAVGVATLFGAEPGVVRAGLFGFSPVLTAIALGSVFYRPSPRVAAFAGLGTLSTVFAQAALDSACRPLHVPTFTAPFILVTWVFLLARADLQPVPHQPQKHEVFGK